LYTCFLIIFDFVVFNLLKIKAKKDFQFFKKIYLRTDGIGDSILFINNINCNNKKNTLYIVSTRNGNFYKDLNAVENYITIDKEKFRKNLYYRFKLLSQIKLIKSDVVVNPLFSRKIDESDIIVKFLNSDKKIGFKGNVAINSNMFFYKIGSNYYNKFIEYNISDDTHELDINKKLFEIMNSSKNFDLNKMSLKNFYNEKIHLIYKNYIIIHIGSNDKNKSIPSELILNIRNYLLNNSDKKIILTGNSKNERKVAKEIQNHYAERIINGVGKFTIKEIFNLVDKADMIISIDTFIVHIAYFLDKKLICFKKNNINKNRFVPYPKYFKTKNLKTIFTFEKGSDLIFSEIKNAIDSHL